MPKFERHLRLLTGPVVPAYVAGHFLNHALGIVSVEAMEALRRPLSAWWRDVVVILNPFLRGNVRGLKRERLAHELAAGIPAPETGLERVEVRGRAGQLEVLPIEDPASLLLPVGQ